MSRRRLAPRDTESVIYKGADGRWHGRVTVGRDAAGDRVRKHVSRKTRASVKEAVRKIERARDQGQAQWDVDHPTAAQWVDHWLTNIAPSRCREQSIYTYRGNLKHVTPVLGLLYLADLAPEHVEALHSQMRANGCSPSRIAAVHRTLRACLNEAVRHERMTRNPASKVRAPKVDEIEINPLTRTEIQKILSAASALPRNGARWAVALALGLRQGEALGLRWCDVDLDKGLLHVRQQLKRYEWKHGCAVEKKSSN